MRIQNTEWGYIEWKQIHNENNSKENMDIGISVILPGKHQFSHIHYGQEQLIYILEGEGIYIINGETKHCHQGMLLYMKSGSTHETINTGDKAIRELLVSNSVYNSENIILNSENKSLEKSSDNLSIAIESIRLQLIEPLNIPITIYDNSWNILLKSNCFSSFCIEKCNIMKSYEYCDCMQEKKLTNSKYSKYNQFTCKNGLTVYQIPIEYKNENIGFIRGGHILLSGSKITKEHENLYDTPESTAISIIRLLKQISKNIVNLCIFNDLKIELQEKEDAILQTSKLGKELENNLKIAKDTVTNLKINHHFLFNTLNSMASMALDGNSYDLYSAIIDLSKMFRYTMKSDVRFIDFKSEISYLQKYINLQMLRYEDNLKVDYFIDEDLYNVKVPFNFIQPIVENAFIHGFKDIYESKYIKIKGKKKDEKLIIEIYNNGSLLNKIQLNEIKEKIKGNSGHGLSLIYTKLSSAYNTNFSMDIVSEDENGTLVSIEFPINYYEGV